MYFAYWEVKHLLPPFHYLMHKGCLWQFIDNLFMIWICNRSNDPCCSTCLNWTAFKADLNIFRQLCWTINNPAKTANFLDLSITIEDSRITTRIYQKPCTFSSISQAHRHTHMAPSRAPPRAYYATISITTPTKLTISISLPLFTVDSLPEPKTVQKTSTPSFSRPTKKSRTNANVHLLQSLWPQCPPITNKTNTNSSSTPSTILATSLVAVWRCARQLCCVHYIEESRPTSASNATIQFVLVELNIPLASLWCKGAIISFSFMPEPSLEHGVDFCSHSGYAILALTCAD